jgi:hypothetical protein
MGAGVSSPLTADEALCLTSFTGDSPWTFDSAKWQDLMHMKISPWTLDGAVLRSALAEYGVRLQANGAHSRNLSTLGAHVALRLPKAWFFSRTDVWMTTAAVVRAQTRGAASRS